MKMSKFDNPTGAQHRAVMLMTTLPVAEVTAILPLGLLAFVMLLSTSYSFVKQTKPSRRRQILTNINAFATEAIQLLLAVLCVTNIVILANFNLELSGTHKTASNVFVLLAPVTITGILALHIVAIYAVDLIEGRILLGKWTHPYDWRCLIITRSIFFGEGRPKKSLPCRRRRALSEPWIVEDFRRCEERLKADLRKLAYLDLARISSGRRASAADTQNRLFQITSSITPLPPIPSQHVEGTVLGFPPTPPSSGPLTKERKRVSWAPEVTLLLPSGAQRRQSLP